MKRFISILTLSIFLSFSAKADLPENDELCSQPDSICFLELPSIKALNDTIADKDIFPATKNMLMMPRIFYGYRSLSEPDFTPEPPMFRATKMRSDLLPEEVDTPFYVDPYLQELTPEQIYPIISGDVIPYWLSGNIQARKSMYANFYNSMIHNPYNIDYAYWKLPEPVKLKEDDPRFIAYLRKIHIDVPEIPEKVEQAEIDKRHWLHVLNTGIQFSQAYISPNWYQGGNNHLALIFNFLWDVQLNQVFHPNLMFQSTVSYKLGLNSQSQDQYHKYAISEDLFQWNLKTGLKAFNKWFYTITAQFKTQFLHNYPENSLQRTASFLSPGDFNIGLGMSYSTQNKNKTWTFNASISPLSYNLKTCIDPNIDPQLFNIPVGKKYVNEIGSSAEMNMVWNITSNISYKTRMFFFSDYKYLQADWENTLSFTINRFLSTQIYVHARYDSSSELTNQKWKHFMLKEILSFGFSYNFSTK